MPRSPSSPRRSFTRVLSSQMIERGARGIQGCGDVPARFGYVDLQFQGRHHRVLRRGRNRYEFEPNPSAIFLLIHWSSEGDRFSVIDPHLYKRDVKRSDPRSLQKGRVTIRRVERSRKLALGRTEAPGRGAELRLVVQVWGRNDVRGSTSTVFVSKPSGEGHVLALG